MSSSPSSSSEPVNATVVTHKVVDVLGWPTDTVEIDYDYEQQQQHEQSPSSSAPSSSAPSSSAPSSSAPSSSVPPMPKTLLLFCPGNPGLVEWYVPALQSIVAALGPDFGARGISYAGHGVTQDTVQVEAFEDHDDGGDGDDANYCSHRRNVQVPWTVNGQVEHKIAWVDGIMTSSGARDVSFIFLSHSIGAHLVQRMLVLREDLRHRTVAIVHWMPFVRMDAPWPHQTKLTAAAQHVDVLVRIGKRLLQQQQQHHHHRSFVTAPRIERILAATVPDPRGRAIAVKLLQHPTFVRNFFELGTEEIRDLPNVTDIPALRLLSSIPTFILYCSNDQWCPEHHVEELAQLSFPNSISVQYVSNVKHDFIVHPEMVPKVVQFTVDAIQRRVYNPNSKL